MQLKGVWCCERSEQDRDTRLTLNPERSERRDFLTQKTRLLRAGLRSVRYRFRVKYSFRKSWARRFLPSHINRVRSLVNFRASSSLSSWPSHVAGTSPPVNPGYYLAYDAAAEIVH